ncbi:craniofacial development protein 2-like protein [Willisornis vidua]|uniref:Craniofacial development protein 2-like protein n=1 Tax=Willisornis vidua TaxID=1566151 RepID=A0ABQ9D040_9PASS|nr:craniofacial development protein 2-like protein [Willisornis vidua]
MNLRSKGCGQFHACCASPKKSILLRLEGFTYIAKPCSNRQESKCEVHLHDEGNLKEHGAGYTLYWSGTPKPKSHLSGVGFMIKSSIASKIEIWLTGHSNQVISLRLPLHNKQCVLFSIYTPTFQADLTGKYTFYTDLCHLTQKVPEDDKIIILGDFNARVGKNSEAWEGVLGKHSVGNCNDNGHLLLDFCAEQQLTITNTIFQQKDTLKTTWMHP